MFRKFIVVFAMSFFIISSSVFAVAPGDVIQAKGVVYLNEENSYSSKIFNKTYARQIARISALRFLAEKLGIGYVESYSEVKEERVVKDYVKTYLIHDKKAFKLLTRHTRQVGEAKFTPIDGGFKCEVTMKLIVPTDWKE